MPFSKLDSGITKSSLWAEDLHVRIVFVSFLAEKDENGFVSGSRSGLIRLCNVTPEQFDHAIMKLSSPDPESKSKDFEGRRIDVVEGGWIVLNSDKYRAPEQEQKQKRNEYMKEYMRNKRKLASVNSNIKLTPVNGGLTSVSVSKSVSKSDSVSGIVNDHKKRTGSEKLVFTPPLFEEFKTYCIENGFGEIADRAFKGYEAGGWRDSQGKQIKSWKQKLQHVWFREENKDKKTEEFFPAWKVPMK